MKTTFAWRFLFVSTLLGGAMLTSNCSKAPDGAQSPQADVIRVGEYASLTGKEAGFGQSSHKGTALAIDEINAAGGVLGKKLELITEDTQSKPGESAAGVRKLISRDKVVAVLGEVASSRSLEAGPICQENKIPMISPSSTNPKVTQVGDYVFRICFLDSFQGKVMARFATSTLKAKKIAMLTDVASAYSVGLSEFFKEAFEKHGGSIVIEQKYSGGDKDFKAQLTAIKAMEPDAIAVPGYYTEAGLISQQARQLGLTIPLFGGDGWEAPELLQIGGDAVNGNYFSTHYSPEEKSPALQSFVKKFGAKYNNEVPDAMAALGYDSAMVLVDAIKRANTTESSALRNALANTKEFVGITGKTAIDAERNATKPAVIIAVKNGKFNFVEWITPEDVAK
jgi:branched-chain amino acid transport system substrate-binding protein